MNCIYMFPNCNWKCN